MKDEAVVVTHRRPDIAQALFWKLNRVTSANKAEVTSLALGVWVTEIPYRRVIVLQLEREHGRILRQGWRGSVVGRQNQLVYGKHCQSSSSIVVLRWCFSKREWEEHNYDKQAANHRDSN